jgi:hypothetical protein
MSGGRIFLYSVMAFFFCVSPLFAQVTRQQRFEHADRNDDGKVDRKEIKMEKAWEAKHRNKVNTSVEKKYDANADGWLEPAETREMLKDKQALIETSGKAKVDSPIEAEYDANKDGVIDSVEAVALKAAIQ